MENWTDTPAGDDLIWEQLPNGHHVRIQRRGKNEGTGVIDGVMPDGTVVWVRFDDGTGRRLLARDAGFSLNHHTPLDTMN